MSLILSNKFDKKHESTISIKCIILNFYRWSTLDVQLRILVGKSLMRIIKDENKRPRILILFYGTIETTNWVIEEKPTSTQLLNCIEQLIYDSRIEKNVRYSFHIDQSRGSKILIYKTNLPFIFFVFNANPWIFIDVIFV